ncbi:MAG: asparagine--tRNA ligase [Candidatus Wallbacteria bacterium]|nr:asparagine--tRNA ligase [Candidatus Wallbacteria bacterium]
MNCLIKDLGAQVGNEVTLRGWMYNRRSSKTLHFLQLRDGSGVIQGVVVQAEVSPQTWKAAGDATMESSVAVTGLVREDKRAPTGVELSVRDVEVLHQAQEYPIQKKEHGIDYLLDLRHLWLRSTRQRAIMKVRATIIRACRDFLDQDGFTLIDAPIFTPNACEGTTTLFETEYFGSKAYLTQSGQLYMEAAAMALGRVYCFGPTFRAEKSKTRRHLTEFWMVEPEVAFNDWQDNMALQERFVSAMVGRVLAECGPDLKALERDTSKLEKVVAPFPRISYTEAIERLQAAGRPVQWGDDFGAEDETLLSESFDRPLFVYQYPAAIKAFYMKPNPADPRVALCNDLLAPEGYGEVIGAGQRMDDLEMLTAKIQEHGLPMKNFEWFLDLRRYGTVPHSGFGMGIERAVSWICGLQHVREAIPFPRTMYRNTP